MSNKLKLRVSRRESLKICLVPASALASQWLIGCSSDSGATDQPVSQPSAGAQGPVSGSAGTKASAGTAAPMTPRAAGSGSAGQGMTKSGAAGKLAAGSGGAGAAGAAGGGSPALAGSGAAGQGGAGGVIQAGSGGIVMPFAGWATGGTKSLMAPFPDPFKSNPPGMACTVYPDQTIGPCYAESPMMREDISDGLDGLPMRLSLLVVSSNGCRPIPGAIVDIWHSGSDGVYSDYATGTICNPGTMTTEQKMFCRGIQMTNEAGRVDFNTIFPGWYRGRALHVHFTVRVNGQETKTSQLYFDDKLIDEIHAQGVYKARGKRDTVNSADGFFMSGNATPEQVVMSTTKLNDGVLHAWKMLSVMS